MSSLGKVTLLDLAVSKSINHPILSKLRKMELRQLLPLYNQENHWFPVTTILTIPSLNLSAITLGKKFFSLQAQRVVHTKTY